MTERSERAVIDAAVIDTLRNAAELLELARITAPNADADRRLADGARDCLDAARDLAARYLGAEPTP